MYQKPATLIPPDDDPAPKAGRKSERDDTSGADRDQNQNEISMEEEPDEEDQTGEDTTNSEQGLQRNQKEACLRMVVTKASCLER
jgi:hypothetical protein